MVTEIEKRLQTGGQKNTMGIKDFSVLGIEI